MSDDFTPAPRKGSSENKSATGTRWWRVICANLIFRVGIAALAICLLPYMPMALRWPWRILTAAAAVWAVSAAIRDSRALTDWLANHVPRYWRSLCRFFERHIRVVDTAEILLCVVLIFFSTQVLVRIYGDMASSSLRQDEVSSVQQYTSKTPFEAASNYNLAKNHIFYTVLNSLTPGGDSMHPLRARFWSFAAVSTLLFGSLIFFAARRQYLEGSLMFSLLAINAGLLETLLEARGYGFIALAAAAGILCALRFLETRKRSWLLACSLTTFLGTWTLPFYILFGGTLQLLLFVLRPAKRTFLYGVWTFLGILLVHSLVLPQIFAVATGYQEKYGLKYVGIAKIFESLNYLLPGYDFEIDEKWLIGFLLALVMSPLVLRRRASPTATMAQVAFALGFGFYLYCLIDGTPPMRIVSWVAAPLACCLVLLLALYLRHTLLIPLRLPLVALFIFVATPWAQSRLVNYDYIPLQKWREAGRIITAVIPHESKIWTPEDYDNLVRAYTDEDAFEDVNTAPDLTAFAQREGIIFDTLFKTRDQERRVDIDSLPAGTLYITLPLRINYHRLFLMPPPEAVDGVGDVTYSQPGVVPLVIQPFDPLTLAMSYGHGDEMLDEDDDGDPFWGDEYADPTVQEHVVSPPKVIEQPQSQGLELPGTMTLQLEENGSDNSATSHLAIILSQTLADKDVTVDLLDASGNRVDSLDEDELLIEGELVTVPLKAAETIRKVTVNFVKAPLTPLQKKLYPQVANDPRPPFTLVDAWVNVASGKKPAR